MKHKNKVTFPMDLTDGYRILWRIRRPFTVKKKKWSKSGNRLIRWV